MARVALLSAGGVEAETLADIVEAAALPEGEVCLLVGDPELDRDRQGVSVARQLLPPGAQIFGLGVHRDREWDCGVIIGPTWAQRQSEFPAYFAYLLGHELGHATTVLTNLTLAAFEDLVLRHIRSASDNAITRWDELPYEMRYDQFGLGVAEAVYGREAVNMDLRAILDDGLAQDSLRIERLMDSAGKIDLDGLKEELAEFTCPYRAELVALWEEERADGNRMGGRPRMANRVIDLNWLWSQD